MSEVTSVTDDTAFFGHPKGLAYLAFTEAWERFSYYGMQTLLVLYMIHQLLLPGHVENIAGFVPFRAAIEHGHPMSDQALASAVFGIYTALVYLTPFFGGLLADRVLGRTKTIVLGACLMALGHFLMAFDQSFLAALLCLMLGTGCFKGNIATQVSQLYSETDGRRADAFQIFYIGINAGVIVAPAVTGFLAHEVAWHWGFGAAGVGMLISLVIYLSGRRFLPPDEARKTRETRVARAPLTGREIGVSVLLIALLPVLSASVVGNQEIFNAYLVWAERSADLQIFGHKILTELLISVDAFVSVSTIALMVVFWRWWAKRWAEPDELGKLIIGCLIGALGPICLALGASLTPAGGKTSLGWLLAFHLFNDIGFANVLPVGLAFYARSAPRAIAGSIVGLYYLHLFAGNLFVGWLGGQLEKMPAAQFWLVHAALVAGAAVVFLVVRFAFGHLLRPAASFEDDLATDLAQPTAR
ncbi:peptide MFS transporter [Phenylobacterium sp.]|jgi:POT family proton-dependent oligopeptide transporter|uniref:peptide MFS transporter n=1 Tax=Phenylobacterium sp. TaxID=1871053 RepID=UPI002F3F3D7C